MGRVFLPKKRSIKGRVFHSRKLNLLKEVWFIWEEFFCLGGVVLKEDFLTLESVVFKEEI